MSVTKQREKPLVSLIVPVYKTERYLARCLDSLIAQTFADIEIICVVGVPPDNSLAVCEAYAGRDARIAVISQTPQGLSAARNEGLRRAKGQYIQFCDSDDRCDPAMCEKMYNAVTSSNADIAVCGIRAANERPSVKSFSEEYFKTPFAGMKIIDDGVFRKTNVFVWNKIFKKSIIDAFGITFPYGLSCEDACFLFKYLTAAKTVYYIEEPLYVYTRRRGSLMAESSAPNAPRALDHIYAINDVAAFRQTRGLDKRFKPAFAWTAELYTSLACLFGGERVYDEAFEAGCALLKDIDLDAVMEGGGGHIVRLYALKKHDKELFFSNMQSYSKAGMLLPAVRACFLFPWYIYKTYRLACNSPVQKRTIGMLLKAYLFFPYFSLVTYSTLVKRNVLCN